MKKIVMLFVLLLILPTLALADEQYHLKLLAVQETSEGLNGSQADIFLELKEGSGRVFLETTPVTKMDTQISTRFAKEIACKHFKLNCNKHDFIYTIRATAPIIGGPSAGAAISALTTIAVLDLNYDKSVTITGTINSGGTIGPVGGVKEKLEAASETGLTKVMVAKGSGIQHPIIVNENNDENISDNNSNTNDKNNSENDNNENISIDIFNLTSYGKENLSLEVIEVLDLDEVVFQLTGVDLNNHEFSITEDKEYTRIMKSLQNALCQRTEKIVVESANQGIYPDKNLSKYLAERRESTVNSTIKSDYYSAASFCFGTNIRLKEHYYKHKKPNPIVVKRLFSELTKKADYLTNNISEKKIETISDLQTMMVVKERINDVHEQINKYNQSHDKLENSYNLLAYGEERLFSAISWMQFFSMDGKKFIVDEKNLKGSCFQKIAESEERFQYVNLFISPLHTIGINKKITNARKAVEDKNYELCLITASQAKADANTILSSLGVGDDNINEFITAKQKAVERVIFENSQENIFPILGYSYYRYADALKGSQKYTAMLYLEYALEISDLSIYFPEEKSFLESPPQIKEEMLYLLEGFLLGVLVTLIVIRLLKK